MEEINKEYGRLQSIYGAKDLSAIYGAGKMENPKVALVFMNPTKRNIAANKSWQGIKAGWLGTKQVWDFLEKCGLFSNQVNSRIKSKKPNEWTPEFASEVYGEVAKNGVYITNLAKCTQDDARPLPDKIFLKYKDLFKQELLKVNPKKIIFFGNQVSSIVLEQNIFVSKCRKVKYNLNIQNNNFECYAVYYPVGNGRFNQDKSIEDIKWLLKN